MQAPVAVMPFIGRYLVFGVIIASCVHCVIFNHDTKDDYKLCDSDTICVRKCCPEGYVLENKTCTFSDKYEFLFSIYEGSRDVTHENRTIHIIHDKNCTDGINLKLEANEVDAFFLQNNGSLFKPNDSLAMWTSFERFCLETFVFPLRNETSALVCYELEKLVLVESPERNNIGKYLQYVIFKYS